MRLRTSAFGADGLIPGTERPERFAFWPMGIESAGATSTTPICSRSASASISTDPTMTDR
jgi:hypothetical protein